MAGNVELQVGRYNGSQPGSSSPFALNIESLVGGLEHFIFFPSYWDILGTIISSGTFAAVGQVHLMGDFDEALLQNCSNSLGRQKCSALLLLWLGVGAKTFRSSRDHCWTSELRLSH